MTGSCDTGETCALRLPKTLDHAASQSLRPVLLKHMHQPLKLNGEDVEFLGGAGAELLLAAHAAWSQDKLEFQIVSPSTAFSDCAKRLGLAEILPFRQKDEG